MLNGKQNIGIVPFLLGLVKPIKGVTVDRSYPIPTRPGELMQGIRFSSEGPSHIDGVRFLNFRHNQFRNATALMWKVNYYELIISLMTQQLTCLQKKNI